MLGQFNHFTFTDFKGDVSEISDYSVCESQLHSIMHCILFVKRKMLISTEGMVCEVDHMIHVPCFSSTGCPQLYDPHFRKSTHSALFKEDVILLSIYRQADQQCAVNICLRECSVCCFEIVIYTVRFLI